MSVEQLPLKCIHIHNNLITRSKSLDESVLDTPGLRFGSLRRQPDTLLQLKDHLLSLMSEPGQPVGRRLSIFSRRC